MPATFAELQALLRDPALAHRVQPSATLEGAVDVEVHRHPVCLEWNAPQQRLELTVPLPDPLRADDGDALQCRLLRALLAWQWAEPSGANHLGFGIADLGDAEHIVGLASIEARHIHDAEALSAAIEQAHDDLFAAWVHLGAQALDDRPGPGPLPGGPRLMA